MKAKPIKIVGYDPEWPLQFERLSRFFESELGELVHEIHHVGSTAVPWLSGKPVIDLDIVLRDLSLLDLAIAQLLGLGYTYRGEGGISGRHAFSADGSAIAFAHHLYVCDPQSDAFKNHISLRDVLRSNQEARDEYAALKRRLAESNAYDMDAYVQGKTAFITKILAAEGFDSSALELIQKENTFYK